MTGFTTNGLRLFSATKNLASFETKVSGTSSPTLWASRNTEGFSREVWEYLLKLLIFSWASIQEAIVTYQA